MNQSDRNPEDEQLDELLRQVDVPEGLKADLRKLAEGTKVNGVQSASLPPFNSRKKLFPSLLLLAATLLGVSAFIAWPYLGKDDSTGGMAKKIDDSGQVNKSNEDSNLDLQPNLQQIQNLQEKVDATLTKLEISRLERRLEKLRSGSTGQLDQNQYTSIILAMADQTVIDLGGSTESVQTNMVSVIDNFPNSKGAEIAQQFLDQQAD